MTDRSRFSIIPIGSLHTGWALKVDGIGGLLAGRPVEAVARPVHQQIWPR
jgi:hypothetical protein